MVWFLHGSIWLLFSYLFVPERPQCTLSCLRVHYYTSHTVSELLPPLCQHDEWWQRSQLCLLLCAWEYCAFLCLPEGVESRLWPRGCNLKAHGVQGPWWVCKPTWSLTVALIIQKPLVRYSRHHSVSLSVVKRFHIYWAFTAMKVMSPESLETWLWFRFLLSLWPRSTHV